MTLDNASASLSQIAFRQLPDVWRHCLDLAWEAHRAGSLPIAAVVTDENGSPFLDLWNDVFPHACGAGRRLFESGVASAWVNGGATTEEVWDGLLEALQE